MLLALHVLPGLLLHPERCKRNTTNDTHRLDLCVLASFIIQTMVNNGPQFDTLIICHTYATVTLCPCLPGSPDSPLTPLWP